ncbi:MAG TPA: peroxiredoxin, partial [Thermoanaerobaculia bacterium]|nr:peroxiredoxin [Thermoanaerobaculia bacterium]
AGKKAVLFGVPGAFTPTCSDEHLPGFLVHYDELKAKGVELIVCVAVNDHHVMNAWGKARNVGDYLLLLADGNGDFARATGLDFDLSRAGMGLRNRRYAMVLDDGRVRYLGVEPAPGVSVSGAAAVLEAL